MNNVEESMTKMIKVAFFFNLILLFVGIFLIQLFYAVVLTNILILGAYFILEKNKNIINGVIGVNRFAKSIDKLIE